MMSQPLGRQTFLHATLWPMRCGGLSATPHMEADQIATRHRHFVRKHPVAQITPRTCMHDRPSRCHCGARCQPTSGNIPWIERSVMRATQVLPASYPFPRDSAGAPVFRSVFALGSGDRDATAWIDLVQWRHQPASKRSRSSRRPDMGGSVVTSEHKTLKDPPSVFALNKEEKERKS